MRLCVAHLALAVSLLTLQASTHKVTLIRKSYRRQVSSLRHPKRTTNNDLLFSDSAIIAPISIGTPAQSLYVLLDTSSSDLALFSPQYIAQYKPTTSSSASTLGTAYQSSSSSSFQSTSQFFQNNYGSGPTQSTFIANTGKDTVSIKGLELSNQPFGVIQSGNVSYGPMASGILGLAFEAISTGLKSTPPIQQLYLDGALKTPVFSFALRRPSSQSELSTQSSITQPGGIFTLGQLDTDQYQGNIGWANLVTSGTQPNAPTKWLAPLDHITVNDVVVEGSEGLIANFDTGSSASRASPAILNSLFAEANEALMSSEGDYFVPCGDDTLPAMNVTISMGGVAVAIEPLDLLYKTQAYSSNGETFCKSTLTTTNSQQYDIQIGDDMMRSLFVAFQYDPPQVGLAAQSASLLNEAAAPSFVFDADDAVQIDSPVSPSAPTSPTHLSVETVTTRATYVPVITEAGQDYTFSQGGQYVPTATESDPPVVASSTAVPLSTSNANLPGNSGISQSSSSSFLIAPKHLFLVPLVATSSCLFLFII